MLNIYWADEIAGQYMLACDGKKAEAPQQIVDFCVQWAESVQSMREVFPDDDWAVNDAATRMQTRGWQLTPFTSVVDLSVP